MPLSLGDRADLQDRLARRMDPQLGAVVHLDADDVVVLVRPRADDLGERGHPHAPELPVGALRLLLLAQIGVADLVQRDVHRRLVVARVVLEPRGRVVRELLGLDEVLPAELGWIHVELVRGVLHQTLDQVRGLGDAERAPVRDATGRLVGVGALGGHVHGREVVGAAHDVEQPDLELRGLGVGVERAFVRQERRSESQHRAVGLQRHLAVHVVVAREPRRDQVLAAVLDPLDRLPQQERSRGRHDVARDTPAPCCRSRRRGRGRSRGSSPPGDPPRARRRSGSGAAPGTSYRSSPGRLRDRRLRRSRTSRAARGGIAGRRCRGSPPCPPWRRPRRLPPCRRPPSRRCGCPSVRPSRRGSAARRPRARAAGVTIGSSGS